MQILRQATLKASSGGEESLTSEQSTTYSLCLTSKTLDRLSQPLLYEHGDIWQSTSCCLARLVHTLVAKPELAWNLRQLSLGCLPDEMQHTRQETTWNSFWSDATAILDGSLLSSDLVMRTKAALSMCTGTSDVFLAILLCLCSRLQTFEYVPGEILLLTERLFTKCAIRRSWT